MNAAQISPNDPSLESNGSGSPVHVAIIMDGNGRWAKARGLRRTDGHREGVEAARRAVEAARDLGLQGAVSRWCLDERGNSWIKQEVYTIRTFKLSLLICMRTFETL